MFFAKNAIFQVVFHNFSSENVFSSIHKPFCQVKVLIDVENGKISIYENNYQPFWKFCEKIEWQNYCYMKNLIMDSKVFSRWRFHFTDQYRWVWKESRFKKKSHFPFLGEFWVFIISIFKTKSCRRSSSCVRRLFSIFWCFFFMFYAFSLGDCDEEKRDGTKCIWKSC